MTGHSWRIEVVTLSDVQPGDGVPDSALVRQLMGDSLGYLYPAALRTAVRTEVADHLAKGPKTAAELAELSGAAAGHLRRVLRFLATRGVFREDEAGVFHLTPAAELLRADLPYSLRPMILLFTDELYWRPAGKLDETVRTGVTAFGDIFGAQFFDYLPKDEPRGEIFYTAMAQLSGTEHTPIAAAYEFPATGTVVDVAGGRGGMLRAVLSANPGLRGVLFDREIGMRAHQLDDPALAERWQTVAGDFFTEVPPGADVYLLKRIIHDKSDADAVAILRSCRRAMSDDAKLLIIDAVIPDANGPHPYLVPDLLMLAIFEGKERTERELTELLAAADLRLTRVVTTPTALAIAEVVPA